MVFRGKEALTLNIYSHKSGASDSCGELNVHWGTLNGRSQDNLPLSVATKREQLKLQSILATVSSNL